MLSRDRFKKLIVVLVTVLAIPVTVYQIYQGLRYLSKAVATPVDFSFLPSPLTLPPDGNLRLMIDAKAYSIGYVRADLSFDTTRLRLSGEIVPTTTLTTVINQTTMAQANSSGRIVLILGLAPANVANAPTGVFELARIPLTAVNPLTSTPTTFTLVSNGMQVVDMNDNVIPNTLTNGTVAFNLSTPSPTASAIPTPTPTHSPTPTPTASPSPSPTPTHSPTPTPTHSPTPTPVPTASASPLPTPTVPGSTPTPIASASPSAIPGDINHDGRVNLLDYIILFENFNHTPPTDSRADINGDGRVNLLDYIVLFENFGRTN